MLAYVGPCDALFAAAARALKPSGRLVFTLEETDGDGFGLAGGGRFAHSESYLRKAACRAGLDVVGLDRAPMRSQRGEDVVAIVAALGRIGTG